MAGLNIDSHPTPASFEALLSGEHPPGTGRPEPFSGSRGRGGLAGFPGATSRGGRRGGPPGFGPGAHADFLAGRGDTGGLFGGDDDFDTEGFRGGFGGDPRAGLGFGGPGSYGFGGFGGPGAFGGHPGLGGPGAFGGLAGQGGLGGFGGFGGCGGFGGHGGFGGFGGAGGFGDLGRTSLGLPPRGFSGPGSFANGGAPWANASKGNANGVNNGPRFGRGSFGRPPFPRFDILASETQYVVEIEVPGVRKEDITVRVNDDEKSVTIEGSFPASAEDAPERVYAERRIAPGEKFTRTIPLPGFIDKNGVVAKLSDGLLIVTVTKVEKVEGQAVNIQ
ncbi:unnamed protein product [Peniophora sp. CBMAI 1063]|nr:unnamed protein product [Peniophora sp. CBMAI 1063]